MTQLSITFQPHTSEKSEIGRKFLNDGRIKFSNDCKRLIHYWQSSGNAWINNKMGMQLDISVSARVHDIREQIGHDKIITEKINGFNNFRLKCTCPNECYLHSENLKIEI